MGRTAVSHAPPPVSYLRQCFTIGDNSGRLLWRERPPEHFGQRREDATNWNARFPGKDAGWMTPSGPMVRFTFEQRTVRMLASRAAWVVATGSYAVGVVEARNGDPSDLRPENRIERSKGRNRFGGLSRAQREAADRALVAAMREHPDAKVAQLSSHVGSDKPCACRRLAKLAEAGLTCGPMCVPSRHWGLTGAGTALAGSRKPMLDDLDQDILRVISQRDHIAAASISRGGSTGASRPRAIDKRRNLGT